jgi:hypothetical protein
VIEAATGVRHRINYEHKRVGVLVGPDVETVAGDSIEPTLVNGKRLIHISVVVEVQQVGCEEGSVAGVDCGTSG